MRTRRPVASTPRESSAAQCSATARPRATASRSARALATSRAPRSSAAGIAVTSIDCFAFVGQPMPQYPMFQHAFTFRGMPAVGIPSFAAPRASAALFSFGATVQGPTERRRSIRSNHGASAAGERSASPKRSPQYASVASGVRKLDVQLTVVEPPTQRPCKMLIALSRVLRAADSW
jgi:hypothetical protein